MNTTNMATTNRFEFKSKETTERDFRPKENDFKLKEINK
jgi:hypothetical protein